jgi:hypothetical protein
MKNNRLRYNGHMMRGAKDLPQRALYRALPEGTRNQRRPKSRWAEGVNNDSRALGHVTGRTSLKIEYNGGIISDKH